MAPGVLYGISAARVKKLQRISFEWVVMKLGMWDERFAALRRFVKEHGHARVPTEFADDPALGEWVSTQLPRHPRTHAPTHPRIHAHAPTNSRTHHPFTNPS